MIDKPIFTYDLPEDVLKTWDGHLFKLEQTPEGKWVEIDLGANKVLLGGLQKLCGALYNLPPKVKVVTFEEDLVKGAVDDFLSDITTDPHAKDQIMGYNVCYDGSQGTDVIAYPRHKKGYNFDNLIPFRLIPEGDNDYEVYYRDYLHSRKILIEDSSGNEHPYIAYYTKKIDINYVITTDDNTNVPDNPDTELHTDKDVRALAQFLINITDKELVEWFSIYKKGKMESAGFNALCTMIGKPSKIRLNGKDFDTMNDTVVFSRLNHILVPHGVDGTIALRYKMLHI